VSKTASPERTPSYRTVYRDGRPPGLPIYCPLSTTPPVVSCQFPVQSLKTRDGN
jgi:hypothetical protein